MLCSLGDKTSITLVKNLIKIFLAPCISRFTLLPWKRIDAFSPKFLRIEPSHMVLEIYKREII